MVGRNPLMATVLVNVVEGTFEKGLYSDNTSCIKIANEYMSTFLPYFSLSAISGAM